MQEVAQAEQTESALPAGPLHQPCDAVERGTMRGKARKREISPLLSNYALTTSFVCSTSCEPLLQVKADRAVWTR